MLTVKDKHIYLGKQKFFYLADTCWSAFTNIPFDDWKYYLNYRKAQGFNVIQINVLKQWDASGKDLGIYPFEVDFKQDGSYEFDYTKINKEYFDRAEKMLAEVVKRKMIPAITLLWCNYLPDTWASPIAKNNFMPLNLVKKYVEYAVNRFKKYEPIYFVSGDTDFNTEQVKEYYRTVYRTAKAIDPNALYSFHIKGRYTDIPDEFLKDEDFFSYQSGHNFEGQHTSYDIPQYMRSKGYKGPIIDTEPCYDQISYSRNLYGRFTARDVRKASWSAVLSGADAGLSYGAHGIWSWHKAGASFGIVEGEGFDMPFDWHDALKFRGANDVHFLKEIISEYAPETLEPVNVILNGHSDIRVAKAENKYLIYVPVNTQINLKPLGLNKNNCNGKVIDLNTHIEYQVNWDERYYEKLELLPCLEDLLVIVNMEKKNG